MTDRTDDWAGGYQRGRTAGLADAAKPFTADELEIVSAALLYYLDELTPMARYRDHIARERGLARDLLAKIEGMRG